MTEWKYLFLRTTGFGSGFALTLSLVLGALVWYRSRPLPWDDHALSATYETIELTTQPKETSYIVKFKYDIQNDTNFTYELKPDSLVLMARSPNGSLSKEWGTYQTSDATLSGPPFIPAHTKARVSLRTRYEYPNGFTMADKDGSTKELWESVNRRLAELNGIVIFDQARHYRLDLAAPWQNEEGVKKVKEENEETRQTTRFLVNKIWVKAARSWGWTGLSSWSDEQVLRNLSTRAGFRAAFPEYGGWGDEQITKLASQVPAVPYRRAPPRFEPEGFTPVRETSVPQGWQQCMYSRRDVGK